MRVLVLFECSGTIRDAFIAAGHEVFSVDLKPGEGVHTDHHLQCDVFTMLDSWWGVPSGFDRWDLVIMHPPCTAISVSGNSTYARGKPRHQERIDGVRLVDRLCCYPFKRRVIENPIGVIPTYATHLGKSDQIIQPYDYGEDASKATCLWLKNVPPLVPTKRIPGRWVWDGDRLVERWSNQTDSGQNQLGPSPERAALRAKTYPGISDAMVKQWSELA